jgi:hypothetical protein
MAVNLGFLDRIIIHLRDIKLVFKKMSHFVLFSEI